MRKLLKGMIFIALCVIPISLQGQIKKEELPLLVNLSIFQEVLWPSGYELNQQNLNNFLDLNFKIDTLNSRGIQGFLFLSISPVFGNPKNIPLDSIPIVPENCEEYIIAINKKTKKVFKLKGFRMNEFSYFLDLLNELNYSHLSSSKNFYRYYYVENIDLECLYKASRNRKKYASKFPCLSSCSELVTTH